MSVRRKNEMIFSRAYDLLQSHEKTLYTQVDICQRLAIIGKKVSNSLFNKLVKGNRIGDKSLKKIVDGLQEIIEVELRMEYDEKAACFVLMDTNEGVSPIILQVKEKPPIPKSPAFHPGGRRTIEEKADFIAPAQKEVVFLGARLNQFSSYFINRKDADFKEHIINLLKKGVFVKCYMADPDSNNARFYFEDRSSVLPKEKYGERVIPGVIADLLEIKKELNRLVPQGKFGIYTYNHLPTAHYISVDTETAMGKMLIANYLFGIPRSKVPVIEVHRQYDARLFDLYKRSLMALIENAREI